MKLDGGLLGGCKVNGHWECIREEARRLRALKSLGLLGVVACKDKLRVGSLTESNGAGKLCFCPGHLNGLFKVFDSLFDLSLLQEQLSKSSNSNVALGVS